MKIPDNYFEKVYSGWLGKIIGIRYGAAIEGWSYAMINDVYGELSAYPVEYKNFAADDDSNGPMFFIRALEDCQNIENFSSQDVARALLNYAPYEHGFFWWGGYGISTEHTAYLNLRSGIPAPRSGSIEQNGRTVAEQIGGQIFIDPWGLVAPGNPKLAAELAEKAAGVTHDGNGIYGGIFIACCVSLAFTESNIRTIIDKALAFIPGDCEYAGVVKSIMTFYDEKPEDWRKCFEFLHDNFGYDKYPGNCHIIPNAGVIILALLYGGGKFDETISICNMCGWDTDCNVGNAGCIMGVMCGIEGISYEKWVKPINDFLACSGVVGSLNAVDIPYGASYFARLAYMLSGQEIPEKWRFILNDKIDACHFEYPTSTHAIRARTESSFTLTNTDAAAHSGKRSLKITVCNALSGKENFFYKKTLYGPEDFSDSRYDPSFSPLVYPGQTVHLSVMPAGSAAGMESYVQIYVRNGRTGEIIRGEKVFCGEEKWHELSMKIPSTVNGSIDETGIIICATPGGSNWLPLTAYIDDLYYDGLPDYSIDFAQEKTDNWNGTHQEISQFTKLKGVSYLDGKYLSLSCGDFGEMYTGHYNWHDYTFTAVIKPIVGEDCCINLRVQGAMRSYAVGLTGKNKVGIKKNYNGYTTLRETDFVWEHGREYIVSVTAEADTIRLAVDGADIMEYQDKDSPILRGAIGLSVRGGSHCLYRDFVIKGI